MVKDIKKILVRDLGKLSREISLFEAEENLWKTTGAVTNSAGNLAIHLIGNLNYYVGTKIGDTEYKRDRPAEFSQKNVPRDRILRDIEETQQLVSTVLNNISDEELNEEFPEALFGHPMTLGFFLNHLSGHLMYHLGQINYLRRVLEG
ncbi:DinB family protein [Rhodohalobacter halophilus]|uniref:DinB family protein n=1 Tax=Rhodohalobacter halophilus TaxID=1812810 RepID=UPI00083F693B|nr:DinB family protein [Rhodohalobacter halophilus]